MSDFLWVEKYRPKTIEECILPENTKKTFSRISPDCYILHQLAYIGIDEISPKNQQCKEM